MKGRYTGYRLYQERPFQEAESGRVHPYVDPAYDCPWSQRGYLFHFEDYQQRTHFDAANTSCCNEPVRPFENKPQYAEEGKPMRPRDCGSMVQVAGCNVLEDHSSVESPCAGPTGAEGPITGIRIKCPSVCDELTDTQTGKRIRGVHGEFVYVGMVTPDVMELEYYPDPEMATAAWDDCSPKAWSETLCRNLSLTMTVQAGMHKPNGCYCDCCANLPGMGTTRLSSCTTDFYGWGNTAYCGGVVIHDPTCSGEGEFWTVYWSSGHVYSGIEHVWEAGPVLVDSPITGHRGKQVWGLSGVLGSFGDAAMPACCGMIARHYTSSGCGGGTSGLLTQTVSTKKPYTSALAYPVAEPREYKVWEEMSGNATYTSGYRLTTGQAYTISGYPSCAWANRARLDFSGWTCLESTYGGLNREVSKVTRSTGQLQLSPGRCSDCCGFGQFSAWTNDGCELNDQYTIYAVRHPMAEAAGGLKIGHILKCTPTGNPGEYKVQQADLYCDGSHEDFTDEPFLYIPGGSGLENCNSVIGSGAPLIHYGDLSARGCLSGASPMNDCCYYAQNGESGEGFRAYILQYSDLCCPDIPNVGAYYVRASGDCCPRWS